MATPDISRHATDFCKHWDDVRMQQGRVLTDDDFNESARLHADDMRQTRLDVIGPAGSPDNGFLIKDPSIGRTTATFTISAGTFYLGGLRLTLETDEDFELQKDWLNQTVADRPGAPTNERYDLVWIEAWEQPVSAVEDQELFEVALGGPDTSVRVRKMHRVHVFANVGAPDCEHAFAAIRARLNADLELRSGARLKVEPDTTGGVRDLCSPSVQGGYLGAENQAIRVQIVDGSHFTWGFDNASPLYRVQLQAAQPGGNLNQIKMLTTPKDHAHWPLADQVVELLPWSALLPNNQKIAEIFGHPTTVQSSYNPVDQTFTIVHAPPAGFGDAWKNRPDIGALIAPPTEEFFYLRVWNRGSDTASPAAIPIAGGVPLGHTGLKLTFIGTPRADDFWIIAARPESPGVVVPWKLYTDVNGCAAQGVHRWFAPLGIIHWTPTASVPGTVDDCRPTFPPLTHLGGCCTYTVGDNIQSYGRFSSIQTAVEHLPPDEGGKICVLPGIFRENVVIADRRNVTIAGCGPRSRVISDPAGAAGAPVIHIQGGRNITLDSLAIEAGDTGPGVLIEGANPDFSRNPRRIDATLSDLFVSAARDNAIRVLHVEHVTIRRCHVRMQNVECERHALFALGDDLLIEHNLVEVPAEVGDSVDGFQRGNLSRGGIQIGGTSERVRILDNLIRGGACSGITLGSRVFIDDNEEPVPPARWPKDLEVPCAHARQATSILVARVVTDRTGNMRAASAGVLREIVIERNRIYEMGLNGIGVVGFYDPQDPKERVEQLTILGNDIRHCLRRSLAEIPVAMIDLVGYGGIALADVERLVIRDNTIADNGFSFLYPVCGIFVLHGEGMEISHNHILNNGATTDDSKDARSGRRGGIQIVSATTPKFFGAPAGQKMSVETGEPALKVHANIVTAPLGPALRVAVLGPISVTDNHFTSRGVVPRTEVSAPRFCGATVDIRSLGKVAVDKQQESVSFAAMTGSRYTPASESDFPGAVSALSEISMAGTARLHTGEVLFADNQCLLELLDFGFHSFVSICLSGLDDIAFHGNQCICKLPARARLIAATVVVGYSVRVIDNRFQETPGSVRLSAVTIGSANITTHNQATHCLLARSSPPTSRLVFASNIVLFNESACAGFDKLLQSSAKSSTHVP